MKLYNYGWHIEEFSKGFKKPQCGWYLTEKGQTATEDQQRELVKLGWGREDKVTKNGAQVIIDEIKSNGRD